MGRIIDAEGSVVAETLMSTLTEIFYDEDGGGLDEVIDLRVVYTVLDSSIQDPVNAGHDLLTILTGLRLLHDGMKAEEDEVAAELSDRMSELEVLYSLKDEDNPFFKRAPSRASFVDAAVQQDQKVKDLSEVVRKSKDIRRKIATVKDFVYEVYEMHKHMVANPDSYPLSGRFYGHDEKEEMDRKVQKLINQVNAKNN